MEEIEVSKQEYIDFFINKDAVISLTGNYPYTVEWTLRYSGKLLAKSTETFVDGSKHKTEKKYFIFKDDKN